MPKRFFLFIIPLLITVSCATTANKQEKEQPQAAKVNYNFANLYNPKATSFHPKFIVYNYPQGKITVYSYLYLPELAFQRTGRGNLAKLEFFYRLTPSLDNYVTIDTLRKSFVVRQQSSAQTLVFPQVIPLKKDTSFLLTIFAKDLNRHRNFLSLINVDRTSPYSSNNFLIKYSDQKPVFSGYLYKQRKYFVEHNSRCDSLAVFYYKQDSAVTNKLDGGVNFIQPDSVWLLSTNKAFAPESEGIYLFSLSDTVQQGHYISVFEGNYPLIRTATEMINPLILLVGADSVSRMLNSYSPKVSVDNFWLKLTYNETLSKELIKAYYNRVQLANIYFYDYRQGWQTDRGKVYVILGAPQIVYKSDDSEKWYYYDKEKEKYFKFVFRKITNGAFENIYIISNGSDVYYWYQAVEQWKKGIIP